MMGRTGRKYATDTVSYESTIASLNLLTYDIETKFSVLIALASVHVSIPHATTSPYLSDLLRSRFSTRTSH